MKKKRGLNIISFVLVCALVCAMIPNQTFASTTRTVETITCAKTLDSLDGVPSYYRPGANDGSDNTYGCHAYVIQYYQAIYKVTVYNLFHARTPLVTNSNYKFVEVTTPRKGDICGEIKSSSNHWSVVKSTSYTTINGKTYLKIAVVDQNNKWMEGKVTKANKNFAYIKDGKENLKFYRLVSTSGATVMPSPNNNNVSGSATTTKAAATTQAVKKSAAITLCKAQKKAIDKSIFPILAKSKAVTWIATNKKVATVDKKGIVKAVGVGAAQVKAKLNNGIELNVSVKVPSTIPAKKLKLRAKDVTIYKKAKWKLKVKMTPSNSTDKLTFTSSNKKIATVSSKGWIKTKKKKGITYITVKATSGKKKKCIVRVK